MQLISLAPDELLRYSVIERKYYNFDNLFLMRKISWFTEDEFLILQIECQGFYSIDKRKDSLLSGIFHQFKWDLIVANLIEQVHGMKDWTALFLFS